MSNHPVHIYDREGKISPSSFIPFCAFGEDMQVMGRAVKGFQDPVCNSFKAKILNNQLCFEADLEKFNKNERNLEATLKEGLVLVIDNNEDRQIMTNKKETSQKTTLIEKLVKVDNEESLLIYLNTEGRYECKPDESTNFESLQNH